LRSERPGRARAGGQQDREMQADRRTGGARPVDANRGRSWCRRQIRIDGVSLQPGSAGWSALLLSRV